MSIETRFMDIADLKARAKRRLPHFVWEFLDSGTGQEQTKSRNRAALDQVLLTPSILHGEITPDLTATFLAKTYALPIGIAPVGMSGLIWPRAEHHLSRAATALNIPYTLSNMAAETPEAIGPNLNGNGWFQLYPPRDPVIRADLLKRARDSGFSTLVFTVDIPVASRRERQIRSGLTQPPKLSPRIIAQSAIRPAWALGMLAHGKPHMKTLDAYTTNSGKPNSPTQHIGYQMRVAPDWTYLQELRDLWDGPLIVKGVLDPATVPELQSHGADAIWVSNHAGRQFDAAPATIEVLPHIRAATDLPLICDGGAESGLDILRAFAMGADFVMMGRAWHYAMAAFGPRGIAHFAGIVKNDLIANMGQLGLSRPDQANTRLR